MIIIYFIVALVATLLGATAGLGGGVIIKPVLDALGHYNLATISILSSTTVLSMAIVSTIKQAKNGFIFSRNMIVLAFGSILGGLAGKELLTVFLTIISNNVAKGIQALILANLLLIVLFKSKLPRFEIKNGFVTLLIGLFLGTVASFLGIGGGPINVAILCMLLGMNIKDAAVNSIFIILLSQLSKMIMITIDGGLFRYDLAMLWYMIPAGIIGGIVGSKLNRKVSEEIIDKLFSVVVILMIALNVFNAYIAFS